MRPARNGPNWGYHCNQGQEHSFNKQCCMVCKIAGNKYRIFFVVSFTKPSYYCISRLWDTFVTFLVCSLCQNEYVAEICLRPAFTFQSRKVICCHFAKSERREKRHHSTCIYRLALEWGRGGGGGGDGAGHRDRRPSIYR